MNKLIVLTLAAGFFLLFLIVGSLGGVGNASAVLLDWSTSKVEEGKLSSTLPESVASGLGGLGNLLVACIGTFLLYILRALHAIAGWIQSVIDSRSKATPSAIVVQSVVGQQQADSSADEETWAKCESLLADAIFRGDRKLTVILCERMHGKPYLINPTKVDVVEVPNA
jgi:hypothetical protein